MSTKASRIFDSLIQEFYEVWLRFHPEQALRAGISGYEGRLPAVEDDDTSALLSWLESLVVGLGEVDFHSLDVDRQIDMQMLFGAAQVESQVLHQRDWRRRDPGAFLPFDVLRDLLLYPNAAETSALEPYLAAVPEFLRYARGQVRDAAELVPRFWLDAAVDQARTGTGCLLALGNSAWVRRSCRSPARIQALAEAAAEAVEDYAGELEQRVARSAGGTVASGRALHALALRQQFFLPQDHQRLRDLARSSLVVIDAQLNDLAVAQGYGSGVIDWLGALAEGPVVAPEDLLEQARVYSRHARRYLESARLAEIPVPSQLRVCNPPDFLCGLAPGDDYVAPPMGDPQLVGTLYLGEPRIGKGALDRIFALGDCLRLGWPGRHLQAVYAARSPAAGTLVRRLNPCPGFLRGWPLYAQGLLVEHGFDDSAEARLALLLARRRCALGALLDLEIHLDGLDPERAIERLSKLAGFGTDRARWQVLAMTREPGAATASLVGWRLIVALAEQVLRQEGDAGLAGFHDRLLGAGPASLPLVIEYGFGRAVWVRLAESLGLGTPSRR
jgi:uncharacterized protein (DUF885 family)